jgi:hypothetical protein
MNTAIVIALIALAGSVFSTIVTVFGAPALQARQDAKKALDNYCEPLLAALSDCRRDYTTFFGLSSLRGISATTRRASYPSH